MSLFLRETMQESIEHEDTAAVSTAPPSERVPVETRRALVLVAGSGRSGTSLFAGTLQRLGFYVPQPEVPADYTNPRGFAESKWVVDFHSRLLRQARVQVADARPTAWAKAAQVGLDESVRRELRTWLQKQFEESDDLVIKDPRLSWFLPLWRRVAGDLDAAPRFVMALRHPAAVVDSKQRSYGGWQGDVSRVAGWLNLSLFTERATRDAPRAFVRYEDLLDDWTRTVGALGETLDLRVVRNASPASMRLVHEFVDRSLSRSSSSWEEFDIPAHLRSHADDVWSVLSALAEPGADEGEAAERLDALRTAYVELYEDAEAIAQSSIVAAQGRRATGPERVSGGAVAAVRRVVPRRVRRKVPLRWRRAVALRLRAARR